MSDNSKEIIYIILSAFCFAMMALFVRLAGQINFMQKAFFRNSVAFFIALILLICDVQKNGKQVAVVPKGAWIFLILRAISGSFGIFGNFYAVDHLILSDAAILNKMSPFFALIFSMILLKEKLRPVTLITIILAFFGALLVVKPSFNFNSDSSFASFAGLLGGIGAGFAYSCVRKLSILKCNSKIVVLFFSFFSMMISLPNLIFNFEPMTLTQFFLLIGAGIFAAGGQFGITAAYFKAPAREISIYDYSQIIFSAALGFIFFEQIPDLLSFAGYIVIISMAIINFLYNKKIHKIQNTN